MDARVRCGPCPPLDRRWTLVLPHPYQVTTTEHAAAACTPAATGFVRAALAEAGTLFDFAAAQPGARTLQGRGPLYSIPAPDGRWVVRHYWRGGAVARWLGDRYLRLGTPRPVQELRVSRAVRERGIATPEVVAMAVYPDGAFYRADLVTRHVPRSLDLARALFGADALDEDARRCAWAAAGRLLRSLHARGVVHTDLNLKNILLQWTPAGVRALVLDLDRCRVAGRVSSWRRRGMLRRFRRSVAKWEKKTGRTVRPQEIEAFEDAYHTAVD